MFSILLTNSFSIVGTIMGVKYASDKDRKRRHDDKSQNRLIKIIKGRISRGNVTNGIGWIEGRLIKKEERFENSKEVLIKIDIEGKMN